MIDNIIENVSEFFESVWAWVKRIWVRILNFLKNIVDWFKDPQRAKRLQEEKDKLAVVIKENLDNGNVNVINCLFNTETSQIEGDAQGIESEQLDAETQRRFGNNEMIVLR
ncbi:hypothetical protein [Helicobacter labacensis]|uniref:hypothetical protein n=1 Tax=Helicobacter labacensis TaxID=2316079 RepID=UPI000EAD941B|nr:hypothetical protein [Helicobacter labacensis]